MNIYLSGYLCSEVGWEEVSIKVFLIECFLLCKLISHLSQQKGNFSDDRTNKNWRFPLFPYNKCLFGGSQLNILGCIFYLEALLLDSEYILSPFSARVYLSTSHIYGICLPMPG